MAKKKCTANKPHKQGRRAQQREFSAQFKKKKLKWERKMSGEIPFDNTDLRCKLCGAYLVPEIRRKHLIDVHNIEVLNISHLFMSVGKHKAIPVEEKQSYRKIWNNFTKPEAKEEVKVVKRKYTSKQLAQLLKGKRGTRISEENVCEHCGRKFTRGWKYNIDGSYLFLCEHCKSDAKPTSFVNIIYTAMRNG